jgi:hypothetical protein
MPSNSQVLYSQQYATAVELVAQQMRPRIASTFTPMTAVGSAATIVSFVDVGDARERDQLYDDIVFDDVKHNRPWVYPRHFDKAIPFDNIEQMQMNANPTSDYVQGVVAALNRKQDVEAIRAFFASRNTGQAGEVPEVFDTVNNVVGIDIGGVGSPLNVEKLQQVKKLMKRKEVGVAENAKELINIVISPDEEQAMMNEIEVISSDFTTKRIMDAGTMEDSGYMGFNWIISNILQLDANGYRRIPVYSTRGMSFCTWNGGPKTNVSQRVDKRGLPWQVYGEGHWGATRRDSNRVCEIKAAPIA